MDLKVHVIFIDNIGKVVINERYTVAQFKEKIVLPRNGSNELLIVRTLAMTVTVSHDQMTVTGTQSKHSQECIDHLNKLLDVRMEHLRELGLLW
jgi:hypothetical protein